ncbi:MAG: patatin-like phospholipase family protein, partial [Nitrospiraceae bacterium]
MPTGRLFGLFLMVVLLAILQGCSYVKPTPNEPLAQWDPAAGYRFRNLMPPDSANTDGLLIVAAFSGGGTRASTLAFGVLRELARQQITWEGKQKRLLDELDVIFALSGGTFTAGYYALRGDQIFHDFEARFLRKDWESELKARVFKSPSNWIRLWSPYFGRAHLMAEILDESLFEGATYGDLSKRNERPWLAIHASDMATLSRFEFNQAQFDIICSDLSRLPIAWASASSAALPLVLSPISLKNYAGQCGYQAPPWLTEEKRKGAIVARRAGAQRANELLSYLDIEKRPNIHLLDGGLSDNMALRGLIEGASVMGGLENILKEGNVKGVRKFVVLAVNAETSPDVLEYRSDHIPVISRAMGAMIDLPINRYSFDTITLIRQGVENARLKLRNTRRAADSPFALDADVYFINASLSEVDDPDERRSLMKIPTTMYLTDPQIDQLLLAASRLIRKDPEFQR